MIPGEEKVNRYTKHNWREVNSLKTHHITFSNRDKNAFFSITCSSPKTTRTRCPAPPRLNLPRTRHANPRATGWRKW
jgi:hypothetical protein